MGLWGEGGVSVLVLSSLMVSCVSETGVTGKTAAQPWRYLSPVATGGITPRRLYSLHSFRQLL